MTYKERLQKKLLEYRQAKKANKLKGKSKKKKKVVTKQVKTTSIKKVPKDSSSHFQCKSSLTTIPSFAEDRIRAILNGFNIDYLTEVSFQGFKTPNGGYYRFDFYVPSIKLVFEYDGEHHKLPENKVKDAIKNNFCKRHKINIFRFNKGNWNTLETEVIRILVRYGVKPII